MRVDDALSLAYALQSAANKAIAEGRDEFDLMEALSDEAEAARDELVDAIGEAQD
jgi:hypothetical protein